MSKHTPGPWCVKPYNWLFGSVSVFAPKSGQAPYGACVAYTPCSDGVGGEAGALANARLIAAAPDLLEALREYRAAILFAQDKQALMSAIKSADDKARAAIAKAEENT